MPLAPQSRDFLKYSTHTLMDYGDSVYEGLKCRERKTAQYGISSNIELLFN